MQRLSQPYVKSNSVLGSLAMHLGLSCAILRYRVLDMGPALNRCLVLAVVGAALLGTFRFVRVVTARRRRIDDPGKAALLSPVLAVPVAPACLKVKPRAEWLIDRLFFLDRVARGRRRAGGRGRARRAVRGAPR